ncbi:putative eukaryotic translation initiation factor 5 [Grifola frondosa]|uniref:Putative eukaryotic translation initiation factor 5 n=1 Tax=Grifola frondosa TaxID=5627 RepID=A0A1C7MS04_GRIFR|nr:putative eukaryotic translation initiation factor 5 [Grifola frondosa]
MAAGVVNIRRDVDDKFYRYRMPILMTKIEGKGNGIKTVIPNMSDNDRYIVNGAHDATKLRELLDAFIEKFVLCKSCKNPETDLIITKNEEIIRDCKACGERTGVDMRHKLTTFIVKNPPKNPKKSKTKKATTDGRWRRESDDELTRRIKAEAAVLNTETAISNEDWSVDTSAEAVKARVKAVESAMDDDSDDDPDSPYSQLGRWVEENRDSGPVAIYKKAEELGIAKKHNSVQVIVQGLFTDNIAAEIPKYAPLFAKLVTSEKHQKALLGGVERFVGVMHPDLIPLADVLEEDTVKQWGTHVSKKYVDRDTSKKVRKASEPFLKWLDEAEDSDEDDDDD